ncbi:MAG: aminotransferase class III-fold pyridoxal phosphate-dependent enzyme [Deltaproteobacteria bacterium]|nr:aminotransferase class III-fold pyridoxal phosphate-dependent enzyme [Deltaproteobacteria bacterium]
MESLDPEALGDLYAESVRPRVARLLKVLKLDVVYTRAEGDRMEYSDGKTTRSVIDMLGGFGSTLLGHNNPELVQALKGTLDAGLPVHAQASIRTGAAFVAEKLNHLMRTHGGDRRPFIVTLCNSGAEAVEAALKHALMEWNERRRALIEKLELLRSEPGSDERRIDSFIEKLLALQPAVVAVQGSFHGKTRISSRRAASSTSASPARRSRACPGSARWRPCFSKRCRARAESSA